MLTQCLESRHLCGSKSAGGRAPPRAERTSTHAIARDSGMSALAPTCPDRNTIESG